MFPIDDIEQLRAEIQALRAELEAKGVLSPPPPGIWSIMSIAQGLAGLAFPQARLALLFFNAATTGIAEAWPSIAPSSRSTPVLDQSTFATISGNLTQGYTPFVGTNRYLPGYGATYSLSPDIVRAFYESDQSRLFAQELGNLLMAHFQNPDIQHFIGEEIASIDSLDDLERYIQDASTRFPIVDGHQVDWRVFVPVLSFLRRLSEGENFSDVPHIMAEAEMFLSADVSSILAAIDNEILLTWQQFPATAYPDEFGIIQNLRVEDYPELYNLLSRWYAMDEVSRARISDLIRLIQPIPTERGLSSEFQLLIETGGVDPYGVSNLLLTLASSPYLMEQLAAAQGGDQSLLSAVMSDPSLISSLAASPIFAQVLAEMFANETLQQTFAQELFGDIEEEDNPIRLAIASAFGNLADAENPIAQHLVQGILGAVDPENPGSSLGGAVRQVVQDVLDTPETGVRPRLDSLETEFRDANHTLAFALSRINDLQQRVSQLESPLRRPAKHNAKPYTNEITEN